MARRTPQFLSLFLVLVVAALALGAIYATRPEPPRPLAPTPAPAPVHLRVLETLERPLVARVYGEAAPWRSARLALEMAGRVEWRSPALEAGTTVAAGEELLRLDPLPAELAWREAAAVTRAAAAERAVQEARAAAAAAALDDLREQEALARREHERRAALLAGGALAEGAVDAARQAWSAASSAREQGEHAAAVAQAAAAAAAAAVERAAAAEDRAADSRARTVLRAPFAGEVSEPAVEVGDWLQPGQSVCVVLDRDRLRVSGLLPVEDAQGVAAGQAVTVAFPALIDAGGRPLCLSGEVLGLDPLARREARARQVVAVVDNPGRTVPAGAFAELSLPRGVLEALWLRPQEYLPEGDASVAFVAGPDGRAERREVVLGRAVLDEHGRAWLPVRSGLRAGERLASDNLEMLADGVELLPVED